MTAHRRIAKRRDAGGGLVVDPVQVLNGEEFSMLGRSYRAQSPDQAHSLAAVADPNTPTYTRHELRSGDQWINDATNYTDNRQRCEVRHIGFIPSETDAWIARSVRVTASTWKLNGYNIITQFNQDPETINGVREASGQNPLAIQIENGIFEVYYRGDTARFTDTRPNAVTAYTKDWTPHLGQWAHLVMHVRFSKATANGVLGVWLNGAQVVNLSNIVIGFNNENTVGPYVKFGIYRSGHTDPIVVEWANHELSTTGSLSGRITSPLPTPA